MEQNLRLLLGIPTAGGEPPVGFSPLLRPEGVDHAPPSQRSTDPAVGRDGRPRGFVGLGPVGASGPNQGPAGESLETAPVGRQQFGLVLDRRDVRLPTVVADGRRR